MNKRVCIFCGANTGNSTNFQNEAIKLCELLIANGYDLVYGGGETGLMGIIADQFLNAGKAVFGVRPSKLIIDEKARENLTELIVVDSMAERKLKMIELSDYFIALPGGIGTLDEIIETFTLQKIGFISKPSGILNTNNYYDGLIRMLDQMIDSGFLKGRSLAGLKIASSPSELLRKLDMITINNVSRKVIDKLAFIELKNGKILATRSYGKDKFYIPGGKRDEGETDLQALTREVKEELMVDLIPESIEYVGVFEAQAHGKSAGVKVQMTCYKGNYNEEVRAASEIEEIKWLNYKDIDLVSHVDKIIFRYLKERGELE